MVNTDGRITELEEQLVSLYLKSSNKPAASLQQSINEKRTRIQAAKQLNSIPTPGILPANIADLRCQVPETPVRWNINTRNLRNVSNASQVCWNGRR